MIFRSLISLLLFRADVVKSVKYNSLLIIYMELWVKNQRLLKEKR